MNDVGFIEEEQTESPTIAHIGDSKKLAQSSVWDDASYDFVSDAKKRFVGITKEAYEEEVEAWTEGFKYLPKFNRDVFYDELNNMEMDIQSENNFSFEKLSVMYSTQVAYRNRLTTMKGVVNAHYEIYNQAYKSLDKQAFKLFSKGGGSVDDRRADAAHLVAPFLRLVTQTGVLLDLINEKISNVEFAAFQLTRLLREREALSRINNTYDKEGQYNRFHDTPRTRIKELDEDGFEKL
jgi:hypothetical protein